MGGGVVVEPNNPLIVRGVEIEGIGDIFRNWAVPVCERVMPVCEQASSSQCPFANWFNWASRSQMVFKYSSHSQMGTHNCARIRTVAKKTRTVREHALFVFRSNSIEHRT